MCKYEHTSKQLFCIVDYPIEQYQCSSQHRRLNCGCSASNSFCMWDIYTRVHAVERAMLIGERLAAVETASICECCASMW